MIKIPEEPTEFDFSSLLKKEKKKKEEQKQIDEFKTEIEIPLPNETTDQYSVPVPDAIIRESKSVTAKVPKKDPEEQDFSIDFLYLVNNSSFQRAIIEFMKHTIPQLKGISHRGSKKAVEKQFGARINEIDKAITFYEQFKESKNES